MIISRIMPAKAMIAVMAPRVKIPLSSRFVFSIDKKVDDKTNLNIKMI
jgi:hypothetical protein